MAEPGPVADAALIARAVKAVAAQLAGEVTGAQEHDLRDALLEALNREDPQAAKREKTITIPGFRGVGPVDLLLHSRAGELRAAIECKWVSHGQNKIYEGAWDAVKLALIQALTPQQQPLAVLITGAELQSWQATQTPDLFRSGVVDLRELWARPLNGRGSNKGESVGEDSELGGAGNMFEQAPERLRISLLAEGRVPGTDWVIKAASVAGEGEMINFAAPPEFAQRTNLKWLEREVPQMDAEKFDRLILWLRGKRWTEAELQRAYDLRDATL